MRKSIFITGAASGIGRETALLFSKRGWFVGLFDLNTQGLKELETQIGQENCCWRRLDVTNTSEYKEALAYFGNRTQGRMDALFNCAGVMWMGRFAEESLEVHLKTIDVNIKGVITGTWLSLPYLRKSDAACIITMGSASAFYGTPELAAYAASKAAVKSFTESLNLELERERITVTDLMPMFTDTPMVSAQQKRAGSLETIGVGNTAPEIAEFVWKAAHGKKVHWKPGLKLNVLYFLSKLFPFAERRMMKYISKV